MHAEPSVVLGVAVIVASAPSLAGWSVGHSDKKNWNEKNYYRSFSFLSYHNDLKK